MNPKPKDFGLYVCLNAGTNAVAICGWCSQAKAFKNLSVPADGDFIATHWWEKPESELPELPGMIHAEI